MSKTIAELTEIEFLDKLFLELTVHQKMNMENNVIWMIKRRVRSFE